MTADRPENMVNGIPDFQPAAHADLAGLPLSVAPRLLGAQLRTVVDGAEVHLRITEVEAYHGKGTGPVPDPGSHARSARTPRNEVMWGDAGHLYVYLSHGIHSCVNIVCGPEGQAGGVLLRAGEVVFGQEVALGRTGRRERDFARGPGRLGQALGLRHSLHNGLNLFSPGSLLLAEDNPDLAYADLWWGNSVGDISTGPRVGVAGAAGTSQFPWRFWITDDPTVSPFRWGRGAAAAQAAVDEHSSGDGTPDIS